MQMSDGGFEVLHPQRKMNVIIVYRTASSKVGLGVSGKMDLQWSDAIPFTINGKWGPWHLLQAEHVLIKRARGFHVIGWYRNVVQRKKHRGLP